MTPSPKQIESEMANALAALESAEHNLEHDLATAINRCYYACFHAARAVLWSQGHFPKTHKGVDTLFNQHLVQTGDVEKQFNVILQQAADERELADYHALTGSFEYDEAAKLAADTRTFVEKMQSLITDSTDTE